MGNIMKLKGITVYDLLELYTESFIVGGNTLYDLAYTVAKHKDDYDGNVDALIEHLVYSEFRSDMIWCCRQGMTFDGYVAHHVHFPYGSRNKEAFTQYLRGVWDDAVRWAQGIVSLDQG